MYNKALSMYLLLLITLNFIGLPDKVHADRLDLEGNLSFWWDIYEENENGVIQPRTGKPAADSTSGFNLKKARVKLNYEDPQRLLGVKTEIRLEERPSLLDIYMTWRPSDTFRLHIGQMKVPSTYEVLESDNDLDFISRSILSGILTDWSLSRAPYYSALYGNRSSDRDMGIGIKGEVSPVSYFLMIGNGLGSNLFIGGKESKGFTFSNKFGDYFYGARLDIFPLNWLELGGHYSINRHDNMLFNDGKTIFDLKRYSWSADLQFEIPRVCIIAMYGAGKVNDDYFYTEQEDMQYSGYEFKCLIWLINNYLQLGARYDKYKHKFLEGGSYPDEDNLSFGLNFMPIPDIRIQLNYVLKKAENEIEPDLDDNILFMNLQLGYPRQN